MSDPEDLDLYLKTCHDNMLVLRQELDKIKDKPCNLAYKFWEDFLRNSKCSIFLANNGHFTEAIAINRLSIENFAYTVSLLEKKYTDEQFRIQAKFEQQSQAENLKKDNNINATLTPENLEKLNKILSEPKVISPGINPYNALTKCGLGFIYTRYRMLSVRGAHATLVSAISPGTEKDVKEMIKGIDEMGRLIELRAKQIINISQS